MLGKLRNWLFLVLLLGLLAAIPLSTLIVSAASRTFQTTVWDGDIAAWGSTYALTHGQHDLSTASYEDSDNVTTYWNAQNYIKTELTQSTFRVGQSEVGGDFNVWRGLLTFDLSALPRNITVSAVSLWLTPATMGSVGDDFNVVIREPGDIRYPAIPQDFDTIAFGYGNTNAEYCTVVASTLGALDYEEFVFNAGGIAIFQQNAGRMMSYAVVSEEDIDATTPDSEDYMSFFSGESQFPPYMEVTYTVNTIGEPNHLGIRSIAIFTDYQVAGDQLFMFTSMIEYKAEDSGDKLPEEYFYSQLLNGASVEAQVPIIDWGYGFEAIYLSAASAIPPAGPNYLVIAGVDGMFLSPTEPTYTYTIQTKDWKGASGALLDTWVLTEVGIIGVKESGDIEKYRAAVLGGTYLTEAGQDMVLSAVPNMGQVRPELFIAGWETPDIIVHAVPTNDMVTKWGAYWGGALNDLGSDIGLTGGWIAGVGILVLAGVAMYLVRAKTEEPILGIVASMGILSIGFLFGFPIVAVVLGAVLTTFLFFYTFWARST